MRGGEGGSGEEGGKGCEIPHPLFSDSQSRSSLQFQDFEYGLSSSPLSRDGQRTRAKLSTGPHHLVSASMLAPCIPAASFIHEHTTVNAQ